jgi:glutathione S-transferase
MRLHDHAASANCLKVRMLLAALDRPYERVGVDIFAGETLTDAFVRLNPLRETPVLELDDGRLLTQSNAILTYLAEGTPLLPSDAFARGQVAQWLSFEQEYVMGGAGAARFRTLTGREALDPAPVAAARRKGRRGLEVLELHLADRDWLVGDEATIADLAVFAYAHVAHEGGIETADLPRLSAWVERVRRIPGLVVDLAPYGANAAPDAGRSIYG